MDIMDALHKEMLDLRAKVKLEPYLEELELAQKMKEFEHALHQTKQAIKNLRGVLEYNFLYLESSAKHT